MFDLRVGLVGLGLFGIDDGSVVVVLVLLMICLSVDFIVVCCWRLKVLSGV